jgi:drug/metabolite transporter (DMT)-like permease
MYTMLQIATAPLSETVRAMDPLATVLLGSVFLKERSSLHVMFTLLPICGGVMLSCASNAEFSMAGFIMVMLSNFAFAGRSVSSRMVQQMNPECMEPFNFFADLSMYGFWMLLPIVAVVEGSGLYRVLMGNLEREAKDAVDIHQLLPSLLMNAVMYTIYAVASFIILQRTDLITHAAVNAFRRVFSILLTALYFGVELNMANLTGIFVSCCGALLFTYFKSRDSTAAK